MRAGEKDLVYHLHRVALDQRPDITLNPNEHTEYEWIPLEEAFQRILVHDMEECLQHVYQRKTEQSEQ